MSELWKQANPAKANPQSGVDPNLLLRRLETALAIGKLAKARNILQRICSRPGYAARHFSEIEAVLRKHDELALLDDTLLENSSLVEHTGKSTSQIENIAEHPGALEAWREAAGSRPETSSTKTKLAAAPVSFIDRVRQKAGELVPDGRIVDRLFERRRQHDMARDQWVEDFRFATALETLTKNGNFTAGDMNAMFSAGTKQTITSLTRDGRSRLYVIGHVGFTTARNHFIKTYLKNSIPFRRKLDRPPYVWDQDDGRTALFVCLRALSSGTSVILAPDGPVGEIRAPIQVAGCQTSMATGGIFLAHETKADVIWLNIVYRNEKFVAVLEKAPVPLPKERLKDYQIRFVAFYEHMLNQYFTGEAASIVMRNRWQSAFLGRPSQGED